MGNEVKVGHVGRGVCGEYMYDCIPSNPRCNVVSYENGIGVYTVYSKKNN